jgi:hypothetical protein
MLYIMSYKSKEELDKNFGSELSFKDRILKLFSIRELYLHAIRDATFEPTSELLDSIAFTQAGENVIQMAIDELNATEQIARFSTFLLLYHHELLVDLDKTKIAGLLLSISRDILSGTLRYPWIFDHLLYDRAYETFADKPRELSVSQTNALLKDTPQGVFQVGNFVVGPFGAMQSEEKRWFVPNRTLPLYHCEDQMCGVLHAGELAQLDTKCSGLSGVLRSKLEEREGPVSQWRPWIRGFFVEKYWYNDYALVNLVWLLGDGFSEMEFRSLGEAVLAAGKSSIRNKFAERFKDLLAAPGSSIVKQLGKPELLQLILLEQDTAIAALLDSLIEKGIIKIPATEIRYIGNGAPVNSWTGVIPECSDLGVRVIGRGSSSNALARLKRLILDIHQAEPAKAQLKWFLRHVDGSTVGEQLESLLSKETPATVIKEIVVSNIATLTFALNHIQASHLSFPDNQAQEDRFLQTLLWKIGFNKTQFESPAKDFWNQLTRFKQVVSSTHQGSSWIPDVRSAGVNLFVGLENLLNESLCFLCWVFLSDPLKDNHVYNRRIGHSLLPAQLDGVITTDRGPILYDPAGKNTLFPLILGFNALARRVQQVRSESEAHAKPKLHLAHYHLETTLQLFPYKHYRYACDITPTDAHLLTALCEELASKLQQSKVFEIRNKLEHHNEELPKAKEMLRCADLLQEIVGTVQEKGLIPTIFALQERITDAFGRLQIVSRDGTGRPINWQPSPALVAIKSLPAINEPQLIIPAFKVPETDEPLRFGIQEDSEHTKMWEDYPKHGAPIGTSGSDPSGKGVISEDNATSTLA